VCILSVTSVPQFAHVAEDIVFLPACVVASVAVAWTVVHRLDWTVPRLL
jgi:hypothetical protein